MSQKAKSILQRIKAKLNGRSKNSKRYSQDAPQGNGNSKDPLSSHFTDLDRGNTGIRPTTASTERHQNASSSVDRRDARQNHLRVVNNDLGRDEIGSQPATTTGSPINASNDPLGSNKERRVSNILPGSYGSSSNRRRSDTAESVSIPRKPVRGSNESTDGANGTKLQEDPKTSGITTQDKPRPDSMAIPMGVYRSSVGSDSTSVTERTDGTQQLTSSPDFDKSNFADFDLTDTVDTDHHTYKAPAVTHEVIRPHVHEIIHKEIHRDIHNHEYQHYIQPVFEQEFLPARHFVPDEDGNLREVSEKDLEGIPGCTGANPNYRFEKKTSLDGHNYGDRDRLVGQTV